MAAGAAIYHFYTKVRAIEEALSTGSVVHLGALLDRAGDDEDTEEGKFRFGFTKS